MNELIEKYFRGETSVGEENELKQYFKSENVSSELEIYRSLFETFNLEKLEKADKPLHKVIPKQRKLKRIWIQTFAYTGIAASLTVLLFVKYPNKADNYAVVNGNKIENTEYAEKYVEEKLDKVNHILTQSLKPMQNIEQVRKDLQPLHKLSDASKK